MNKKQKDINPIIVVAALIKKEGKVLIAKRSTGDQNVLGKWEFPGGKIEQNENEFQAIEREIEEELSIKIRAKKFIINNICKYPGKIVDLRLYECEYLSGEINLGEHSKYSWVEIDKLLSYNLALADIPLAQYLINENKKRDGLNDRNK